MVGSMEDARRPSKWCDVVETSVYRNRCEQPATKLEHRRDTLRSCRVQCERKINYRSELLWTGFFRYYLLLLRLSFISLLCMPKFRASTDRQDHSSARRVFLPPFLSIHLMGEAYFACHNELAGINKHRLSRMYYKWRAEPLESFRSHTRCVVLLLPIQPYISIHLFIHPSPTDSCSNDINNNNNNNYVSSAKDTLASS